MSFVTTTDQSCSSGGRLIRAGIANVNNPAALVVSVGGAVLSYLGVATSVETKQTVLAQFQPSLNEDIYVVPFGDAVGDTVISFIANRQCNSFYGGGAAVSAYYLGNRFRPSRNKAISISVGGLGMTGYLVGVSISGSSDSTPLIRGTLFFKSWPT